MNSKTKTGDEEIEVKVLEIDPMVLRNRLEALGAEKVFEGEVFTLFYDASDGSISKRGDLLRLRRMGDKVYLTYKHHVSDGAAKIRDEYETEVGSLEEVNSIFTFLGLHASETMRKHRTSFFLYGSRIEIDVHLDKYSYIPALMEIEAISMEDIWKVAEKLGYNREELKNWSFFEVAKHYSTVK
jgi:adenylate cyclase class 2